MTSMSTVMEEWSPLCNRPPGDVVGCCEATNRLKIDDAYHVSRYTLDNHIQHNIEVTTRRARHLNLPTRDKMMLQK